VSVTREEIQDLIAAGDLSTLFLTRLHWDNPRSQPDFYGSDGLPIPGTDLTAFPVTSKRVVDLWHIPSEPIPPRPLIRRTVTNLRKRHSLEMLMVFESDDGQMLRLWPEQRRTGNGFQLVERPSNRNSVGAEMLDRLYELRFDPKQEEQLTATTVLERVRLSLDVDLAGLEDEVEHAIASAVKHLHLDPGVSERINEILCQEPGDQTDLMAASVLFNAVVFQHHIAARHEGVPTPEELRSRGLNRADVQAAWEGVLKINYWPIFGIAHDLLTAVADNAVAVRVLGELYSRAAETTAYRDAQGIIGELYGRLVADRAFLKTHFTRLGSAAFLAEIAVDRLDVDWADPEEIARLRIADLACGTGALLTAAHRRIAARHEEAHLMAKQGGVIGKCWRRLSRHRRALQPSLRYTPAELDDALNDLHDPHDLAFKELAKALDSGMGDEDLAALLVQLRRDGLLAKSRNDQDTKLQTESQVICSMGLAGQSA